MDKGEGNFTFDFRSFEGGGGEGGTGDADGDGTPDDPFANPDGGPLSRIEAKLDKLQLQNPKNGGDDDAVKKFDEPSESPLASPVMKVTPAVASGNDSEVTDVTTSL